jgi:hypothetical protein
MAILPSRNREAAPSVDVSNMLNLGTVGTSPAMEVFDAVEVTVAFEKMNTLMAIEISEELFMNPASRKKNPQPCNR